MEPLVELERSRWAELRDLYKENWPENIAAYSLLDNLISYPNLSETFNFKVYCPFGDIHNGMVAIMNRASYEVMIHPVKDISKIEEALAVTKVIDLNRFFMVAFASQQAEECLKRVKNLGERMKGEIAFKHIYDKNSPKFEDLSTPPNTYVSQIKPEHVKFIDEKWTYHDKNTHKFFEVLRQKELTYVLYTTEEEEPVAWVVIDNAGSLTHLYCVEEHRKKGYAEFIAKYAVNDRLSKGKNVLAYTLEKNFKAHNLFDKLGFQRFGYNKWLIFFPRNDSQESPKL